MSPETDKRDCLLLDFGGCLARFGPIDRAKPAQDGRRRQESRIKECPGCHALCPVAASACEQCGLCFECRSQVCDHCGAENRIGAAQCEACGSLLLPDELEVKASTQVVLSDQVARQRDVQCFEVDSVSVEALTARGSGRRYLRVYYDCGGFSQFDECIHLGYDGYPGKKAMRRMRRMLREDYIDMPETDPDTFVRWNESVGSGMLRDVRAVYVDLSSEWDDVTYVEYWTDEKRRTVEAMRQDSTGGQP